MTMILSMKERKQEQYAWLSARISRTSFKLQLLSQSIIEVWKNRQGDKREICERWGLRDTFWPRGKYRNI